ncbi:MAG: Holliday junction resolvase RuvX [Bacteroidales bacterium]|nr:Holliday junction resolvase RuvX [Bacteroidales bacterium]
MARVLAIDYGTKRVGIAVSDPLQIIATSLTTIHSKDILFFLKEYTKKENVECFVVGEPRRFSNEPSEAENYIEIFLKSLKKEFPEIPVERIDERFTSKIAAKTILDSGVNKKTRQNKSLTDKISATLILQTYLELKTK